LNEDVPLGPNFYGAIAIWPELIRLLEFRPTQIFPIY